MERINLKKITTPLTEDVIKDLKSGDEVLLSGIIFAARDQAHLRLNNLIKENKPLPFDIKNQIIYYVGPTPAKPGEIIGSAGPTTSSRMDLMTIPLLELGLKGMIGKGKRSKEVIEAIKKYEAVYFAAPGGAGAYLSQKITKSEIIAFEDLGPEAIYKLNIVDFPLIVINDIKGGNFYH